MQPSLCQIEAERRGCSLGHCMKSHPSQAQNQLGCKFRHFWICAGYSPRCLQHFRGVNPDKSVLALINNTSDIAVFYLRASHLGVCPCVVPNQQRVLVVSQDVETNLRLLNLSTVGWMIKIDARNLCFKNVGKISLPPGYSHRAATTSEVVL